MNTEENEKIKEVIKTLKKSFHNTLTRKLEDPADIMKISFDIYSSYPEKSQCERVMKSVSKLFQHMNTLMQQYLRYDPNSSCNEVCEQEIISTLLKKFAIAYNIMGATKVTHSFLENAYNTYKLNLSSSKLEEQCTNNRDYIQLFEVA